MKHFFTSFGFQKKFYSFAFFLLIFSTETLSSQTFYDWNGGAGNWSDAAQWTPNGVPGAIDFITVYAGTVTIDAAASVDVAIIGGGTVTANNPLTINTLLLNDGALNGTADVDITSDFTWDGGAISGAGKVQAQGLTYSLPVDRNLTGRTLVLLGTGTWSGGNINVGSGATFRVATGATFTIDHDNSAICTLGSDATGVFEARGTVNKTINSTTRIACTFNTNGGSVNVNAGTLVCYQSSSGTNNGLLQVTAGANIEFFSGSHTIASGGTLYGDGTTKINGGILTLNAGSSLTTSLNISTGTLTDNNGALPVSVTQSGGTFNGSSDPICTGDFAWSGGDIAGSGTFTVQGNSTFSGTTRNLNQKILHLDGNGNWSAGNFVFSNNSVLRVGTTSILLLSHPGTQSVTGTGTFEVNGELDKSDAAGTTDFTSNFINNGLIKGVGTINFGTSINNNTFSPGFSPGLLKVNTFDNTLGTLEIELESAGAAGIGYDQLAVTGAAILGGTLNVTLLNDFEPSIGDAFTILTGATVTGVFDVENLPGLPVDREWDIAYNASEVIISVISALLPVELKNFQAQVQENDVLLTWQTASEQDNWGFHIERRAGSGERWAEIGFVNGKGTAQLLLDYHFTDTSVPAGIWYYRLRQTDFNGKEDLSPVRSITVEGSEDFDVSVYPNPVIRGADLNVRQAGSQEETKYALFNLEGEMVQQGQIQLVLPTNNLPAGVYLLRLTGDFDSKPIRIVVQ